MSSMPPGPPQGPPNMPPPGGPQYPPQGGQPQYPQQYPPQYQQYPPQYPQQYPPQGQPPKKSNVLLWVLIAVAVVVFVAVAGVSIGSYMLYRTVKNAGFDPELMSKNPGLALTKMMATVHPDMQVVSTDDAHGTVTVREKTTGKILTFRWDPDKKTLVVIGDDGKQVKFSAAGDEKNGGSLTVESGDGTVKFGATPGNTGPAWVPVYPGTTPQGTFSTQTGEGSQSTYAFKTSDPPSKVLDYFKQQLSSAGFKVNLSASGIFDPGSASGGQGGILQATSADEKRTVMITAGASSEGTTASVTAVEKK
jgi:hypothetical protein